MRGGETDENTDELTREKETYTTDHSVADELTQQRWYRGGGVSGGRGLGVGADQAL